MNKVSSVFWDSVLLHLRSQTGVLAFFLRYSVASRNSYSYAFLSQRKNSYLSLSLCLEKFLDTRGKRELYFSYLSNGTFE